MALVLPNSLEVKGTCSKLVENHMSCHSIISAKINLKNTVYLTISWLMKY